MGKNSVFQKYYYTLRYCFSSRIWTDWPVFIGTDALWHWNLVLINCLPAINQCVHSYRQVGELWFTDLGSLPHSAHRGYEKHKEINNLIHNIYLTGTGMESILSAPACELWRMKAQNTCRVDFINDHETNQWRFWHKKFVLLWRQLNYSISNLCWRFAVSKRAQRKPCWS